MKWNDYILAEFPKQAFTQISILLDPESLVGEEEIFTELEHRQYCICDYTDRMSLRYLYEHKIRHNQNSKLVIVLRDDRFSAEDIPYDISKKARSIALSLSDLFPSLNFSVADELDRKYIPGLFEIREDIPFESLGEAQTCEFILEHLFGISTEVVNHDRALLKLLFHIHSDLKLTSPSLLNFLAQRLQLKQQFSSWNVAALITSATNFREFLQERWHSYANQLQMPSMVAEPSANDIMQFQGPVTVPFTDPQIKPYVKRLFSAGILQDNSSKGIANLGRFFSETGTAPGIDHHLLQALLKELENKIPDERSNYAAWLEFSAKWAVITSLSLSQQKLPAEFSKMHDRIESKFSAWLQGHYHSLASLPPQTPVMAHHIIRSASRKLSSGSIRKFALIVMDGLAFNQWAAISPLLEKSFSMSVTGCFAWIPTLTCISRQAIFAGCQPALFPASINTTNKEETLWYNAWEEAGINKTDVIFGKYSGEENPEDVLDAIGSKTKVCGIIVRKVDDFMHGKTMDYAAMQTLILQWMKGEFLTRLISGLLAREFTITLTSDHGNIQCIGNGPLQEGVLSETKGQRIRIYPDQLLAANAVKKYPGSCIVSPTGLPSGMFPVTLPYKLAFATKGDKIVSHGGSSLEEVIVPLVTITEKKGKA